MVPFAMLLLQALLPSYGGDNQQTLTRLYELLYACDSQLKDAADPKLTRNLKLERQQA